MAFIAKTWTLADTGHFLAYGTLAGMVHVVGVVNNPREYVTEVLESPKEVATEAMGSFEASRVMGEGTISWVLSTA